MCASCQKSEYLAEVSNTNYGTPAYSYLENEPLSDAEQKELDALLKEAKDKGYNTIGEYQTFLATQNDEVSQTKIQKIQKWIDEGKFEKTLSTAVSIFSGVLSAWNNFNAPATEPKEEEKPTPYYLYIGIGVVLLVVGVFTYKSIKK